MLSARFRLALLLLDFVADNWTLCGENFHHPSLSRLKQYIKQTSFQSYIESTTLVTSIEIPHQVLTLDVLWPQLS
jgi:hypothetical protein